MEKVLIFAGTKEGRQLAEYMCQFDKEVHISVATEYGEEVLPQRKELVVHRGRLTEEQMEEFLRKEEWQIVIDATHPYAIQVSANLRQACDTVGKKYIRLLREEQQEIDSESIVYVNTKEEAAQYLNGKEGNILLTTGSKELWDYVNLIKEPSRIFARILADGDTVNRCREMGLRGNQIICMQGPFSAELNNAMLRQIDACYLVTKDTGKTGGFPEKIQGARKAGVTTVVIRRPKEEQGYSMWELLRALGLPEMEQKISLVGIGLGNPEGMTLEAYHACMEADVILGARRMVEGLKDYGKPIIDIYLAEEVISFLKEHPEYHRIVVAFSGDVGFYSGAAKLQQALKEAGIEAKMICGISSVVYMASKLNMPWQDMKLISMHGRVQNLVAAVRRYEKVFSLAESWESIQRLASLLMNYGMDDVQMHVGSQLSYPEEVLFHGTPEVFVNYNQEGLAVVVLENPKAKNTIVTHGLPDTAFIRGDAPMTKEEIRSISLSKLALRADGIVYDIGAGTGSIGIECALQMPEGTVYAIEKQEATLELLHENKRRLGTDNLEVVAGIAPEACMELPAPTHAFIGGSSGNMEEIIDMLLRKNPKVRIVINAIALETVAEVTGIISKHNFAFTDIATVSVGKSKSIGRYHMMMGQNPVYIFTLQGE